MRSLWIKTEAVREEGVTNERLSVLVSVLQRNRTSRREKERERERGDRLITKNWLTWLWRLRSPKIGKLETQESRWSKFQPEGR